jgi:hypothetical protein
MKLVIDISHWQNLTDANYVELKAHGVSGVIAKLGQGRYEDNMAETHARMAAKHNLPFAGYFWHDPIDQIQPQLDNANRLINKYDPAFLAVDTEQWWLSWSEWYNYYVRRNGIRPRVMSPDKIYEQAYGFTTQLHTAMSRVLPIGAYTGDWFIKSYCRRLPSLIKMVDFYWRAWYPDIDANDNRVIEWVELLKPRPFQVEPGAPHYEIWQFAVADLPGALPRLDYNWCTEGFYANTFAKQLAEEEAENEDDEVQSPSEPVWQVLVDALNVRAHPNKRAPKAGLYKRGALVEGTEVPTEEGRWIKVGEEGYMCIELNGKIFLKEVDSGE